MCIIALALLAGSLCCAHAFCLLAARRDARQVQRCLQAHGGTLALILAPSQHVLCRTSIAGFPFDGPFSLSLSSRRCCLLLPRCSQCRCPSPPPRYVIASQVELVPSGRLKPSLRRRWRARLCHNISARATPCRRSCRASTIRPASLRGLLDSSGTVTVSRLAAHGCWSCIRDR